MNWVRFYVPLDTKQVISETFIIWCASVAPNSLNIARIQYIGRTRAQNQLNYQLLLIISRLLYTLPAWGGFLSVELVNRINAFFDVCSVSVIFSVVWL